MTNEEIKVQIKQLKLEVKEIVDDMQTVEFISKLPAKIKEIERLYKLLS